jgi:hypothetical protein
VVLEEVEVTAARPSAGPAAVIPAASDSAAMPTAVLGVPAAQPDVLKVEVCLTRDLSP